MNKTLSISGSSFTIAELRAFLAAVEDAPADDVRVRVSHSAGDRPWNNVQYTLSVSYPVVKDIQE